MANMGIAEGVGLIAWGAIVLGTMDNIVRFVLAKKMADVHPLVTLLGVIMGLKYFGITGLIFGPLLISYFLILLKIYYQEFQQTPTVIKKKRVLKTNFKLPFLK
jgi:predicted PurR-regulated permease PerM